jgi:heptosyltransferase-3
MANRVLKSIELAIRSLTLRTISLFDRNHHARTSAEAVQQIIALGDSPSILLLRQDRLGDVVMSTPIFVALRRRYPKSRIYVLLGHNNQEAAPLLPIECEVAVYRKRLFMDIAMVRSLRDKQIDIAIDLTDNASVTSSILLAGISAKVSVGFEKENGAVYDVTIPRKDRSSVHISVRIAQLLAPFGISPDSIDLRPQLHLTSTRVPGRIGLNVSSRTEERCAPPAAASEIAIGLLKLGYKEVLVFAAPHDLDRGRETVRLAGDPCVRLVMDTPTFREFGERIASCEYFITVDTSAIQLAAAARVPMVLMFRPMPGEHPWTPAGVPFEIHTQYPSLSGLEAEPVLELFRKLVRRTSLETMLPSQRIETHAA